MLASTSNLSTLYYDWTLIVFTVLAQFGAGTAIFASIANSYNEMQIAKKMWISIFIIMSLAGIVSTLHLQNPFNAFYTITQIGHSWLSREILAVGIFTGLVFLQIIKLNNILAKLTAVMGMILVFVISQVYASVASMPFWSNVGTLIAFFGTAFLLGGAFALLLGKNIEQGYYRNMAVCSVVLGAILSLGAKLGWIPVLINETVLNVPEIFSSSLYHITLQVLFIAIGLISILPKKMSQSSAVLSLGVLCFLLAELSSRTIFFIAQLKIGV